MKTFSKFFWIAFASFSMALTSCNNSDDEPTPEIPTGSSIAEVFPMGVPASVGDATIEVNDKGLVSKIVVDNEAEITFEYGDFSRASNYNAVMRFRSRDNSENYDIYLQLNKQGFISYARLIENGEEDGRWEFEYDENGHLIHTKSQWYDGVYDQEATIKYVDGDITEYKILDADEYEYYTVSYTNSTFKQPVLNKGGIMLYEEIFEIDLDEIELAYYAGLLGKGTKNLPMAISWSDDADDENSDNWEFGWDFNEKQLPLKFYDNPEHPDFGYIIFRWR